MLQRLSQAVTRHMVLWLILLAITARIPLLFAPLTYSLSDTWRQADTASIAHNFTDSGDILYPRINWGGSGPGYVEAEFQLYPYIVSLLYRLFGENPWFGRLVSLAFTVAALYVFHRLALRLTGGASWALFFLVIAPLSIRYSVAFMPEATVLFFYLLALLLFQKWLDEQNTSILALAGAATALAILVKPTSIHIGLVFALLLYRHSGIRFMRQWRLWLFALIALLPGTLWYLHARNLYLQYGNTFGVISGGDSKFGGLDYWLQPGFYLRLAQLDLKWVLSWVGLLPFLIGLALIIRQRSKLFVVAAGSLVIPLYYVMLARYTQEEWGIQYHIYALPYACLAVGLGIQWLIQQSGDSPTPLRRIRWPYALAGALTVVLSLGWSAYIYGTQLLVPSGQELWECARYVSQLVPYNARIIVSTTVTALDDGTPNNFQEPNIFFYSHRYGWSLPADRHTAQKVHSYREQGAAYFVIVDHAPLADSPDLAAYLQANAQQIGPGEDQQCSIYRFEAANQDGTDG